MGDSRNMKLSGCGSLSQLPSRRLCVGNVFPVAAFICIVFLIGSAFVSIHYKEKASTWEPSIIVRTTEDDLCKSQSKPAGSDPLPTGIISRTSNFERETLWGSPNPINTQGKTGPPKPPSKSLLALAVGVKQKEIVYNILKKFSSSEFTLVLFHYDGIVDEWRNLFWSGEALHVSAINQTKWWFAKRFLHPDIVAEYDYIFLWDEDLDVEHFNPNRYLSIIRREGLEISQPGLDTSKSQVHYKITARMRKGDFHRRVYRGGGCENSTSPPCTGWVEMMAPVFSRAAWRCAWYMIQNDLIHAWGLDKKLGYCAQGERSQKIGVVDSEFIGHKGLPTLGGSDEEIKAQEESSSGSSQSKRSRHSPPASWKSTHNTRFRVRSRAYYEMETFKKRWQKAVEDDKCWIDPYRKST